MSETSSIFATPRRFLRAAHIVRDFGRPGAQDGYVVTRTVERAQTRILDSLATGGERSWRLTGDYGTGKSSFALHLAGLMSRESHGDERPRLLPILVVGERCPIEDAVADALVRGIHQVGGDDGWAHEVVHTLPDRVEDQLKYVATAVAQRTQYTGLLLVLDELGKFLEYAAARHRERGIYVLQQIADLARGHEPEEIVVLCLLHQGLHAYADHLPSGARREWDKVAGRFEEIVFNQSVAEQARLAVAALGVDARQLATETIGEGEKAMESLLDAGWYGPVSDDERSDLVRFVRALYPVHPTVLPVLSRFCAVFGQHERSLFEFLLASTPFGVQAWSSAQPELGQVWYRLNNLFDYIRYAYAQVLNDQRTVLQWSRICEILDASQDRGPDALILLKSIGILNALDADDLRPTPPILELASGLSGPQLASLIERLKSSGRLYSRGRDGGMRLWPASSVSLDQAFKTATSVVPASPDVASYLTKLAPSRPIVARRHYIERGTLRHFDCEYIASTSTMQLGVDQHPTADGRLLIVLCSTEADRADAMAAARELSDPQTLVGVSDSLDELRGDVLEVERWRWVIKNTRELSDDKYAQTEASRQLGRATQRLRTRTDSLIGLHGSQQPQGIEWFYEGKREGKLDRKGLLSRVSDICDEVFSAAPRIKNELLNRAEISSSAAKARGLLIQRLFEQEVQPNLGMNDERRAPPEKAVYLSVIRSAGLHVESGNAWALTRPTEHDPKNFAPTFEELDGFLESCGTAGAQVPDIIERLQQPPFGIRAGLLPLILAIYMRLNRSELAVYEDGSFAPRADADLIQRLTKVPQVFRFQICRVQGPRADALRSLGELLGSRSNDEAQDKLLDVVTHLCVFAAKLPTYTKKTTSVSGRAQEVRRVLLMGREPATLLFDELPAACGLSPLSTKGDADEASAYAAVLSDVCDELRNAYPRLLDRLRHLLYRALDVDPTSVDARQSLSQRARRVSSIVREPTLTAFCARIRDDYHDDDDPWIAAIAAIVRAQPPEKWRDSDEATFEGELLQLADRFRAVEQIAFTDGSTRQFGEDALITVIDAAGAAHRRVVRVGPEEKQAVDDLATELRTVIRLSDRRLALAALARIAKEALSNHGDET